MPRGWARWEDARQAPKTGWVLLHSRPRHCHSGGNGGFRRQQLRQHWHWHHHHQRQRQRQRQLQDRAQQQHRVPPLWQVQGWVQEQGQGRVRVRVREPRQW